MVVQVCTVNGPTGLIAVKNVRAEFLVDSNITTVALNQSLKNELMTMIDGQTLVETQFNLYRHQFQATI